MIEGAAIGGGFLTVGAMLQLTIGPIDWLLLAFPLNVILFALLLLALGGCYVVRKHFYVIRWCMTLQAAIPALVCCLLVTLVMGLTGWDNMLSSWPFVLVYVWLMFLLGLTTLHHLFQRPSLRQFTFVCNHLGLFLALVCGVLGYADMQKLHLTTRVGTPEWRAVDVNNHNQVRELPLALELHSFTIDEYPPAYKVIDNETGQVLEASQWVIRQDSLLDYAAIVYGATDSLGHQDDNRYVEWRSMGACTAAYITATNGDRKVSGWVSCGSFMFPYKALRLDDHCSAVMPDREPQRYVSDVTVYTEDEQQVDAVIEVNHPLEINGWKIYQLSYDEALGRWSDTSVFELVRDPWLPWVYAGIFLMLAGALGLFLIPKNNRRI